MSVRKTFLVMEPKPSEGISVRKLVLETAYYNVLTGYSGKEGIQLLEQFPNVDAAVIHAEIEHPAAKTVFARIKELQPDLPIIVITPGTGGGFKAAAAVLSSHDPQELLEELKQIAGPPK